MKKVILFASLLCVLHGSPALADECSIDLLNITDITNQKVASGVDSSTGKLFGLIAELYLNMPVPTNIGKVKSFGQYAAIWGQEVVYDPLEQQEQDFVAAIEDITNLIGTADYPDDLIVRINGARIVPYSTASKSYTMHQGGGLPFFPDEIKQSFRTAATFQLIEEDRFNNDNLGLVTMVSSPVLNSRIPEILSFTNYSNIAYNLETLPNLGRLLFQNGDYSFILDSGFDDLTQGETREVSFTYTVHGKNLTTQISEQIGPAKTVIITITGSAGNEPPVAVDETGATSNTSTTPPNGNTITIFAPDPDDGSIYDVTYSIERGAGNIDDIAERLVCNTRECIDIRETPPIGKLQTNALNCPLGYTDMYPDAIRYSRICTAIRPPGCGSQFEILEDIDSLKDGDVIVLSAITDSEEIGISSDSQYLSICNGCTGPSINAVVSTIDPNRSEAQWTVKKFPDGKIALRSATGHYLVWSFNSVLTSDGIPAYFALANTLEPTADAQFSLGSTEFFNSNLYSLKSNRDRYLSTCFNCVLLQSNIPGYQYAADINKETFSLKDSGWIIRVKRPKQVTISTDLTITVDEIINPTDHWLINPGTVLTVNPGQTLTIKNGASLENQGTIINKGTIFIEDAGKMTNLSIIHNGSGIDDGTIRVRVGGVIDNQAGAVIDNSDANHIGNLGSVINAGVIYDPWDRYDGINPTPNLPENSLYFGPDVTGEKSCAMIDSPTHEWDPVGNSCTLGNTWLRNNQTLTVANGVTLILNGTLTNGGTINNNDTIDNTNGLLRQCGTFSGNNPASTAPGDWDTVCIKSTEQVQCEDFNGIWNTVDTCENVQGKLDASFNPVPIATGEVLTIRDGVTWEIIGPIENDGEIHIEKNGAVVLPAGIITNRAGASIINDGTISINADSFGTDGQLENNGQVSNYGTINNGTGTGYIYGAGGFVDNWCGSVYTVDRTPPVAFGDENVITDNPCPPPPPDSDSDGVEDALDDLPNNPDQISDIDGDGFGDNPLSIPFDMFPKNRLEHADSDGDCGIILIVDQTTASGNGCGDNSDAFPENFAEQADTDGDCGFVKPDPKALETTSGNGCGDNSDALPADKFETTNSDTDLVGDNSDLFPLNGEEQADMDGDCGVIITQSISSGSGCGDNSDSYPNDADNTRTISFDNSNGWKPEKAVFVPVNSIPVPPPTGSGLSNGLVDITLSSPFVRTQATFTITYPEPLAPDTVWWKYGGIAVNPNPHWYVFDGAVINGNTVTLTITDGGPGDDDLTENGRIVDHGGPGMLVENVTPPIEPVEQDNTETVVSSGGGSGSINIWYWLVLMMTVMASRTQLGLRLKRLV